MTKLFSLLLVISATLVLLSPIASKAQTNDPLTIIPQVKSVPLSTDYKIGFTVQNADPNKDYTVWADGVFPNLNAGKACGKISSPDQVGNINFNTSQVGTGTVGDWKKPGMGAICIQEDPGCSRLKALNINYFTQCKKDLNSSFAEIQIEDNNPPQGTKKDPLAQQNKIVDLKDQFAFGTINSFGEITTYLIRPMFEIAAVAVVFYLLFGAFKLITSAGDKNQVASARNMITHAFVGLILLLLLFLVVEFIPEFLNLNWQIIRTSFFK